MLSLVNDLLDIKMIEKGVFEPSYDNFSLKETLEFVLQMFSEQSKMTQNEITHQALEPRSLMEAYDMSYDVIMLEKAAMPEVLYGDVMRLK